MGEPAIAAKAEGLIMRGLAKRLLEGRGILIRIGRDDLCIAHTVTLRAAGCGGW